MPAIRPERPTAPYEAIDGEGDANGDAAHAFGQGSFVARFDDQVDVIPLHGEMNDPEAPLVALGSATKGEAQRRKHVLAPERPKLRAERDVNGMPPRVLWSCAMEHHRARPNALTSGVGAAAASPLREWKILLR
jgi:hypothetical protein